MKNSISYKPKYVMHIIGILAGLRPCGIIVLVAELFRAESKSQVYANLHEFMRKHPQVSENLGNSNFNTISFRSVHLYKPL